MKGSLKLGTIAGIGVFIHWTFTFLIAFVVFINYRNGQKAIQIAWAIAFLISIFFSVFLHELGHALAAKKYGIKTKDITFLPIGGIARLEIIPEKPIEELLVALAGPFVNIAIALICLIFIGLPTDSKQFYAELSNGVDSNNFILNYFLVNFWLAAFNLIPAFPMDGGRVLRALLSFKIDRHIATKIAARIGQFIAIVFVFFGFFSSPFLVIIGVFIFFGAQIETEITESKFIIKGFKVRDVIMKQYPIIDVHENLKTVIDQLLDSQNQLFLVTENTIPVGTLNRDLIFKALAENGENQSINAIMNTALVFFDGDALLENIFEKMFENKANLMLIMENNKLIGTIDTENLMEFILIKEINLRKKAVGNNL